jgi:ABC-type multidrug transport system fused ATPase/permease subunit
VIGIVGPTGAGKSTLVQLLLRLRAPTRGAFLAGDVPAADVDDEAWHRKVAYLPQEPHLVRASPRDNVRFFREWIDEAAVTRAMRLAHIADEVDAWADGPRAIIGERADGISGGQRQRLCLARALAGEPELLVLDEPTSALDPHSERLIAESLVALRGRLTMVIVAHRLSTLEVCDRIMVIQDGRLDAFSGADELLATNDFYRRAFSLSSHGAEPT